MTLEIPIGPFFIPKYKIVPSGVDFLGMRQANLDLMDICIPGVNNYTRYVRGFAVLAWIYWKFHELMVENEMSEESSERLIRFKEKAEVLFTWGHQGLGLRQVPGIDAKSPSTGNAYVDLSFAAWKRDPDNTSLMAAPTYGPASKTTNGLGFVDPVKADVFRVYGNGIDLAKALDEELNQSSGYALLVSLDNFAGDYQTAKLLFPAWDVRVPSLKEQLAFRTSFYDLQSIGTSSAIGRRSATIALVMDILNTSIMPLNEQDIRVAMAYRILGHQPLSNLSKPLEAAWLRWLILQIRQAQRLAFESLFAWIESRIIPANGDRDSAVLVQIALDLLSETEMIFPAGKTPGDVNARLLAGIDSIEKYLALADNDVNYCLFSLMSKIQKSLKVMSKGLIPLSMRLLSLCSALSGFLQPLEGAGKLLSTGGVERISLRYWHTVFTKFSSRPTRELLRFVFENLLLSQHYGVAAFRFDGKKQRLRIGLEEEGLVSLVAEPLEPFIGADRLQIALCLMADCGLIENVSSDPSQGLYSIKH